MIKHPSCAASFEEPLPKRRRGNPNFTAGNKIGILLREPLIAGEKTVRLDVRIPVSLKAKLSELPGNLSENVRKGLELLLSQPRP